ncbi:hypothetical protein [Pseudoduganella violaceinigra]|uniref:hypothetical protein n=1 Tax=Pseudoduganella violaceinigra TaxID=246602 RepID=UPI00048A2137|nr:hypothetical protein [Pseudoduganella violaceinigra]
MDNKSRFARLAETLAGEPGVDFGQGGKKGFGSSALKVNGKIFAMVSAADEFVVKLPRTRVDELEASGIGHKFDPGHGKLMKEWLALNPQATGQWTSLAQEALRFVGGAK